MKRSSILFGLLVVAGLSACGGSDPVTSARTGDRPNNSTTATSETSTTGTTGTTMATSETSTTVAPRDTNESSTTRGDTTGGDTGSSTDTTDEVGAAEGIVSVRLEEIDGVFIEGFEVGLRFETGAGEVVASTLWSDFVQSQEPVDLDAYYDSVLDQPVPAGRVVVLATVNLGAGPPPEVPDPDGALRCRLDLGVPDGATVEVEVSFSGTNSCLRQL